MIDLTPLEVRKKKGDFRRQIRGYDPELVDDFLDLVADRLEQLVRENMSITEKISLLETQVSDYRDREKALTEALVTAQEMRDEIRKQIAKEAELSRRESEAQSESMRTQALQAREREEEAIRHLRARQAQLLQSYRTFLERELGELSVMAETLEVNRVRPVFEEPEPVEPHPLTPLHFPEAPIIPPPPVRPKAERPSPDKQPAAAATPAAAQPKEVEQQPRQVERPAAAAQTAPTAQPAAAPVPQAEQIPQPASELGPFPQTATVPEPALFPQAASMPTGLEPRQLEQSPFVVDPPLQPIPMMASSETEERRPAVQPQMDLREEIDDDESENAWVSTLIERKS